ncbi:MAG: hypothetical protein GY743_19150 [Planctomycetaceae bacterium]|nr:hypothetical protein [Planctomycetaceae bacterium]
MNNSRKEVKPTAENPDPVMTATEVVERSRESIEALNAAIREISNSTRDKMATVMADLVIKHLGDYLSPDDLAQLIAIKDGEK